MKSMVTGLGLEEKGGQTGDRVARREEEKEKGEGVLTPDRMMTPRKRIGIRRDRE